MALPYGPYPVFFCDRKWYDAFSSEKICSKCNLLIQLFVSIFWYFFLVAFSSEALHWAKEFSYAYMEVLCNSLKFLVWIASNLNVDLISCTNMATATSMAYSLPNCFISFICIPRMAPHDFTWCLSNLSLLSVYPIFWRILVVGFLSNSYFQIPFNFVQFWIPVHLFKWN